MQIQIFEFVEGAKKAQGLTIIIDVFRAFSLAVYAFDRGAERIIPVENVDQAFNLKKTNPEYILVGERQERKVPGFDFGNSPTEINKFDFSGKTIIHTTSAGTKGLTNASHASEIITGSFVNAKAIIQYIRDKNPEIVSLVAMGFRAQTSADEDILCAQYIKNELEGEPNDYMKMISVIREGTGSRFFDPSNQKHSPPSDFDLCLDIDRFSFVLEAIKKGSQIELRKIPINLNKNA